MGSNEPEGSCRIRREWAMPNKATFSIGPINGLVERIVCENDGLWVDPYSGEADFADVTNDLNPEIDSDRTMDAIDFLHTFDAEEIDGGILFDPPYSPRQIKEVYDRVGLETTMETTQATFWSEAKDAIERAVAPGAVVATFGWNSGGIGKTRGFQKEEILLVAHGGWHNDTICVVERYNGPWKENNANED